MLATYNKLLLEQNSSSEIKTNLKLQIPERKSQQILRYSAHFEYKQCEPAPFLECEQWNLPVK